MCYLVLRADAPVPAVWADEDVRPGVVAEIRFTCAVLPEERVALEWNAEGRYGRGVLLEWVDLPPATTDLAPAPLHDPAEHP